MSKKLHPVRGGIRNERFGPLIRKLSQVFGAQLASRMVDSSESTTMQEVSMPVWISEPRDTAGDAVLRDWRVLQTYAGSRHFVGSCTRTGPYRVSPPITSFSADSRTGVTKHGLRFVLTGPPAREKGGALVALLASGDVGEQGLKHERHHRRVSGAIVPHCYHCAALFRR